MRTFAATLLALGLLLGAARVLTGIVNGVSETTYLVAKGTPALWMERAEIDGPPIGADHVIDAEDGRLAYDVLYVDLMRAAPWFLAAGVVSTAAMVVIAASRRRRRGA